MGGTVARGALAMADLGQQGPALVGDRGRNAGGTRVRLDDLDGRQAVRAA